MKTKAAVLLDAGKPFEIMELDLDGPKEGEVLIKYTAAGLCHSDLHLSDGDFMPRFPIVGGHEGAGIVVEVGEGVTSVKPGDHVIPLYTAECGQCKFCKSGKTNLCQKIRATQGKGLMPDGSSRFSYQGQPIHHYMGCSTFSEYTVVAEVSLAVVHPEAPLEKVCLLGCGVTTGIGAVIYTAKVWPGANVVVFGLGGIGLNVLQAARMVGADKIIGVDINPAKRAMAEKFGMTDFINPAEIGNDKVVQAIVDLTGGGADFSFDATGNTNVMRQALECCHRGWGKSVIIGGTAIPENRSSWCRTTRPSPAGVNIPATTVTSDAPAIADTPRAHGPSRSSATGSRSGSCPTRSSSPTSSRAPRWASWTRSSPPPRCRRSTSACARSARSVRRSPRAWTRATPRPARSTARPCAAADDRAQLLVRRAAAAAERHRALARRVLPLAR